MSETRTKEDLRMMQALPLGAKVSLTQSRIRQWVHAYGEEGVHVSFSGGKDSTVLLHLVREMYPDVEAVFVNTGLEYPEIQQFVKSFDNVTILRPKMRFDEVIKKYGYPLIGKEASGRVASARKCIDANGEKYVEHYYQITGQYPNSLIEQLYGSDRFRGRYSYTKWKPLIDTDFRVSSMCCEVMKKKPIKEYEKKNNKKPMTAQMASESQLRTRKWIQNGCNGFDMKSPISNPMSFWTEQDVLQYIKQYKIPICSVYGDIEYADNPSQLRLFDDGTEILATTGCNRTGCVFCGFGCHLEKKPSRFQRLKETHPRQYAYCMDGGEYVDGVWKPNKEGLGMRHVFEELNNIYGDGFIKYE